MHGIKRFFVAALAAGVLALVAPTALADHGGGGHPRGHHGHFMKKAMEHLGLSDAQKAKVRAIFEDTRTRAKALDERRMTGEERRKAMRALHEKAMTRVDAVLTPEQRQKLDTMRARHAGKRFVRHLRRGLRQLDLSEDQRTRVRAIVERARGDARTVLESESDRAARRQALEGLRDQVLREVEGVLSAEQKRKWNEMRQRFEERHRDRGV